MGPFRFESGRSGIWKAQTGQDQSATKALRWLSQQTCQSFVDLNHEAEVFIMNLLCTTALHRSSLKLLKPELLNFIGCLNPTLTSRAAS